MTKFDVLYRLFSAQPQAILLWAKYRIIRLNAAAFMNFSAFQGRRVFEGGVYFEITFFKSLTTAIVNRL